MKIYLVLAIYILGVLFRILYLQGEADYSLFAESSLKPFLEYDSFFFLSEAKHILANQYLYPYNPIYEHISIFYIVSLYFFNF